MNLLIMGAPGAGKGSVSSRIVEKYGVVHISTGDMLRAAMAEKTPIGLKVKDYMDSGSLVPDKIIHDMIIERLSKDDIKKGFLFDGYPRTLDQAIDLDKILKMLNKKIDAVINLDISDETVTKRITGRRLCLKCGEIYNIYYKPSQKEEMCDKCGSPLTIRNDDNIESLQVRLKEYHKNADPILAYYDSDKIVHHIKADQTRLEVFADVVEALEERL